VEATVLRIAIGRVRAAERDEPVRKAEIGPEP